MAKTKLMGYSCKICNVSSTVYSIWYYANLFLASFTTFITLKKEYFFLVDWFPVAPISDDWLGKDGVLPAEIVFLIQEEADEAGEPNGDTHEDEPKKGNIR